MEYLAKSVGTLCILVVAMGILYNLGSFPATEKVIKFVIAIYIVTSALKIMGGEKISFKIDFDFNTDIKYQNTENFNEMLTEQTQADIEKLISQRFDEKNIAYNSVDVHILEQNNLLSISKIVIDCDDRYKQSIKESIDDLLSENTEVIIGDTDCEN